MVIGVDDGARTHDRRDHNPELYQLSYVHHRRPKHEHLPDKLRHPWWWRARQDSNLRPSA